MRLTESQTGGKSYGYRPHCHRVCHGGLSSRDYLLHPDRGVQEGGAKWCRVHLRLAGGAGGSRRTYHLGHRKFTSRRRYVTIDRHLGGEACFGTASAGYRGTTAPPDASASSAAEGEGLASPTR